MFIRMLAGFVGCILALVFCSACVMEVDETITCCGVAVAATVWWSRPGGLSKGKDSCTGVVALIVALELLMRLVQEFPVCHVLVHRGLLCWTHRCPVAAWSVEAWLNFEGIVCCPHFSQAAAVISIGMVCGLSGVRAFATPLRQQSSRG